MKEHIKRLYPSLGAVKSWDGDGRWDDGRIVHFYTDDQVCQIARLIVEECAKIAQQAQDNDSCIDPCGQVIKEHFGI